MSESRSLRSLYGLKCRYIIYSVVIKAGDCLVVADQSLERLGAA